jgi:hypothetical protein
MYILSRVGDSQRLIDGINREMVAICTYFHLQKVLSL